ncbi:MAG: 23S rRNA (pseudouridine(1915)-N(3))-methyltransferase RlmH [Gemmatimonadota bacterium]|nr:23S rRNA (pseudouridine(1915)-N(3))-methyltransferase RlmH [Gemmatimonadota bacterium]MDH5284904.1 23S rRNA (pseudouridine(1915)-N(3))-methyltransferase RlmH [Gemmatimonadota bacterium]
MIAVGRLRPACRDLADDYIRRIGRFGKLQERECREAGKASTIEAGRRQEATRLRGLVAPGSIVVALDRAGEPWTSETLARRLDEWRTAGRPVSLLLGGSHGLDPALVDGCDGRWSLGPLTLPHELARVIVYEQLYRGFTILHRTPYHK